MTPKQAPPKPCPRCYAPMVEDPAAPDGWSCVKHGPPGSDGPIPAPPVPEAAANGHEPDERAEVMEEIKRLAVDGRPPSSKTHGALKHRALKVFSSWNEAVEAAGLTPNHSRLPTTEQAAVEQASPVEPEPDPVEESQPEQPPAEPDATNEEHQPTNEEPLEYEYHGTGPYTGPSFADLAAELEAAFRERQAADRRFGTAQEQFLKHPVFDFLWELHWPYDYDKREHMRPEKLLMVAAELLKRDAA